MMGAYAVMCAVCGTDTFPQEKMSPYPDRPGSWLCPRDSKELTLEELSRYGAVNITPYNQARVDIYKVPTIPQFLQEEGRVFSLVTSAYGGGVYQYRTIDVINGDGSVNTANKDPRAAGWAGIYLWEIINEGKRPKNWRDRAKTRLEEVADFLLTYQRGSGLEAAEVTSALASYAAASTTTLDYGGFVNLADLAIYSEDVGACGLALLRAYQVFGKNAYLLGYQRALTCLRRMQQTGKLSTGFTAENSAATIALHTGMWTNAILFSGGSKVVNHRFYAGDAVALEFLEEAKDEEGDTTYGDTTAVGPFGSATDATLSTMISDCVNFWKNGIREQGAGSAVVGFSSATPRELFRAYPGVSGDGTGQWDYFDVANTSVSGLNYGLALRGLYASAGYSAQVKDVFTWLQAGASNATYQTTALNSLGQADQRVLLSGELGNYNPKICISSEVISASGNNNTSRYEWATVGLMGKLRSAQDRANFDTSKREMSRARYYSAYGPDTNRVGRPILIGQSGLSFQVSFAVTHDVVKACMAGLAYREAPKIYGVA